MKIKFVYLVALLLAGTLLMTGTDRASGDVLSNGDKGDIQRSETNRETGSVQRFASVLSLGRDAVRSFRDSRTENVREDARLDSLIRGLECSIDPILSYVSCYSSPIDTEEKAEILFTKLVEELQGALPSDRWIGMKKKPGIASIRSYTYEDQKSNSHIDIDIIPRMGFGGQNSYIVSTFGWAR